MPTSASYTTPHPPGWFEVEVIDNQYTYGGKLWIEVKLGAARLFVSERLLRGPAVKQWDF